MATNLMLKLRDLVKFILIMSVIGPLKTLTTKDWTDVKDVGLGIYYTTI